MLKKLLFVMCLCVGIFGFGVQFVNANTEVEVGEFLLPVASGVDTFSDDAVVIDYSNATQGYFMAKATSSDHDTLKLVVSLGKNSQKYEVSDTEYQTYPLNFGDGIYIPFKYVNTSKEKHTRF